MANLHLQQQREHWAIVDSVGKAHHIRTWCPIGSSRPAGNLRRPVVGIIRPTRSSTDASHLLAQFALARGQMMIQAELKSDPIDFLEGLYESRLL